jgi:hypothetical protein
MKPERIWLKDHPELQTWFEFGNPVQGWERPDGTDRWLRPGETIRFSNRARLHIVNYGTTGEARRLESPVAAGPRDRSDETRFWLAPGAVVQVADVHEVKFSGGGMVWVRLVPPLE